MKTKLDQLLQKRVVILDGACGTQLQKQGMPAGACPELWCRDHPKDLAAIHAQYRDAGADIIYTATFGANRPKLSHYNVKDVVGINRKLARIARRAVGNSIFVAGDIGPTGEFVQPFGKLAFERAVAIFKEQVKGLKQGGVDLFVIETMMDIQEARAALLAVKETTTIPVFVTMTIEKHGRTLNGNDPVSALITLQSLGADAVGCNCSTGPADMKKFIRLMKPYATVPLVAKANAGIPVLSGSKAAFTLSPHEFARQGKALVSAGVNVIGGCCGTTPEHIRHIARAVAKRKGIQPCVKAVCALSSARKSVFLDDKETFTLIGERINPTGKKALQKELRAGRMTMVRQYAKEQEAAGARLLDVNVGVPGADEKQLMLSAMSALSVATDVPLVIDSSNPEVIEAALRLYPGRALLNSISGEKSKIKKLLPLVKQYGALFILLPLEGKSIPATAAQRKGIIKRIFKEAKRFGVGKESVVVDALAMTLSSRPGAGVETLKTIEWCAQTLRVNTVIGLSNSSFGLPNRQLINQTFLTVARSRGLTLAIAAPTDNRLSRSLLAKAVILNKPGAMARFVRRYADAAGGVRRTPGKKLSANERITQAILEGDKRIIVPSLREALGAGENPLSLLREVMIPAVITVGDFFDQRKYFLPQLIASAETMKQGVAFLEPLLNARERSPKKKAVILVATVSGDIHDIGKNIVVLMLKNHGFAIVDLGKDVSTAKIIRAIKQYRPHIVGLSALMTTTMVNMKEVVTAVRAQRLRCQFMVGGAVVNKEYADSIGAAYARDGVDAVRVAHRLCPQIKR